MERRWRRATEQRRRRLARLKNIHAAAAVALAALLAVGCADQPAAPTPPVIAPAPPAVSVEIEPTTARVGEVVTSTYRLSRALDYDLEFWTEVTPPSAYAATFDTGETFESGPLTIRAGETYRSTAQVTCAKSTSGIGQVASRASAFRMASCSAPRRAAHGPSYRDP